MFACAGCLVTLVLMAMSVLMLLQVLLVLMVLLRILKFLGVISSYYLDALSFRIGANHGDRLQLLTNTERYLMTLFLSLMQAAHRSHCFDSWLSNGGDAARFCGDCIVPLTIRHVLLECSTYSDERRLYFGRSSYFIADILGGGGNYMHL